MAALLQLQKLPGKGDGGWEKKCLCVFSGLTKDRVLVEKCVLGHPIARATSYYFLPDGDISSGYGPPKMPLKLTV